MNQLNTEETARDINQQPSLHFLTSSHGNVRNLQEFNDADLALNRIKEIYNTSCSIILSAFNDLQDKDSSKDIAENKSLRDSCYPYIGIHITNQDLFVDSTLAFGVIQEPGFYGTTVTRPDIFEEYYREQIGLLIERHKVPVVVGLSEHQIPLPFVIEQAPKSVTATHLAQFQNTFVLPNLSRIDDSIANCTYKPAKDFPSPLSLFSAERVDYSLSRLHHYTGTAPKNFQGFILLTNYQRYIDEFIEYGLDQLAKSDEYSSLVMPGDVIHHNPRFKDVSNIEEQQHPKHLPQMPAYHLTRPDNQGITFINIGVGPSNAKNITDHLAVLRPHCWLMLGHCAGLRPTQLLGDYVLAHAYIREDHVLDQDLPNWVPIPPIAEVQVAMQQAVENISDQHGQDLKTRMRTGTVVTTDNRNWELQSHVLFDRFRQSRAIAIDMESATVAANGLRFRVPYGTLLCVSDKPIHGELKLRGMANQFYQQRVNQHLKIGLESIRILREQGVDQIHSRKLRGFDEPPFR